MKRNGRKHGRKKRKCVCVWTRKCGCGCACRLSGQPFFSACFPLLRYYYSIEELSGREGGGDRGRKKSGPKCSAKPGAARLPTSYVALRFWWVRYLYYYRNPAPPGRGSKISNFRRCAISQFAEKPHVESLLIHICNETPSTLKSAAFGAGISECAGKQAQRRRSFDAISCTL